MDTQLADSSIGSEMLDFGVANMQMPESNVEAGTLDIGAGNIGSGTLDIGGGNIGPGTMDIGVGNVGSGTLDIGAGNTEPGTLDIGAGNIGPETMDIGAGNIGPGTMDIGAGNIGPGTMDIGVGNIEPGTMDIGGGNVGPGTMDIGAGNIGPETLDVGTANIEPETLEIGVTGIQPESSVVVPDAMGFGGVEIEFANNETFNSNEAPPTYSDEQPHQAPSMYSNEQPQPVPKIYSNEQIQPVSPIKIHLESLKEHGIYLDNGMTMSEFLTNNNKAGSLSWLTNIVTESSDDASHEMEALLRKLCIDSDDPFLSNMLLYTIQSIRKKRGLEPDHQLVRELIDKEKSMLDKFAKTSSASGA